jgi:RimJ/RimL family protein N-acetyltransferase
MSATWQTELEHIPVPTLLLDRDEQAVREFLESSLCRNIYLLSWMEYWGLEAGRDDGVFHFRGLRDSTGQLQAVSLVVSNRLVLLEASDESYARRMGRWYRKKGYRFEHIVSPADVVSPFWKAYGASTDSISARLNKDQLLLSLEDSPDLPSTTAPDFEPNGQFRTALPHELEPLVEASARMQLEETKRDPLRRNPSNFRDRIRQRIEAERSFVWFHDQELVFKADISAQSQRGAQVSGVYTAPPFRGRGIASEGLLKLCKHLFAQNFELVTLYADRQNKAALRVYEKIGFAYEGDYQTIYTN